MARNGAVSRKRRGPSGWSSRLTRFASSGLSVAAFCRREGVSVASFYRWRGLLGSTAEDGQGGEGEPMPAFVDLDALGLPRPAGGRLEIRLDLGGGLILSLVRG